MFLGTTQATIANYVHAEMCRVKPKRVLEPYAGNFIISQLASKALPGVEIISSDVSLYSVALGFAIANMPSKMMFTNRCAQDYPILFRAVMQARTAQMDAAAVVILTEARQAEHKAHHKYYANLVKDIRQNGDTYLKQMLEKIEKLRSGISQNFVYKAQDGATTIAEARAGDLVYFDPPYFTAGYEKMFKGIEELVTMPPIEYTMITEDEKKRQIRELLESDAQVLYRTLEPKIRGMKVVFEYRAGRTAHYLHANYKAKPGLKVDALLKYQRGRYKVMGPEVELTGNEVASITPIVGKMANYYRIMWTKKAKMVDMGTPYGMFLDDMLIGVIRVGSGQSFGMDFALVVSDATPMHTLYKKLSRLPLYGILTDEFLARVNADSVWEHNGFTTVAVSNEPVSMKYRGLFDLAERSENDSNEYKWKLTYRQRRMFNPTVQKAYEEWFKRYGKEKG